MKKKMYKAVIWGVMVILLTGCGGKQKLQQSDETEKVNIEPEISEDEPDAMSQLEIFAEHYQQWQGEKEYPGADAFYGTSRYAVCDLDEDGTLELIEVTSAGSDHFSENHFYQVQDGKVIELEQEYYNDGEDEFDIDLDDKLSVYKDTENGRNYYFTRDFAKDSGWQLTCIGYFWLEDGKVHHEAIAFSEFVYDESVADWDAMTHYYGQDGLDGEEITWEEFQALQDSFVEGKEQKELALNWVTYADKEHGFESKEDALDKLMNSYQGDI